MSISDTGRKCFAPIDNSLKILLLASILLSGNFSIFAQGKWDLTRCINYALDNNIELNKKYNAVNSNEIDLKESKLSILPDLNLGSTFDLNFGRNIDGNTNAITYDRTYRNSYWANSSVDLFRGLVKSNNIRFNKYLLMAKTQEAELQKNLLIAQIMSSFYMVLYSQGLEEVAKNQLSLSGLQFERMQKFVDVGRESPITAQELKSQWAADKLSLTRAANNLRRSLLELKQLLRLNATVDFEIDSSVLNAAALNQTPDVDSLFRISVSLLPEVKQKQFLLDASERDLAMAKGNLLPSIYMSAGFSTGYFDGDTLSYKNQMNNNQNQWVSMGIRIPVFNNASTYSRIKRKQIALEDRKLDLQKQRDDLYSEIWTAVDELQSAKNEYLSANELFGFSKLTLENVSKRLEKGLVSTTEFEAAKQRFISAKAGLLKSKLIYLMRKQMLEFYRTGNWDHLKI
jgi:outer membrane protein